MYRDLPNLTVHQLIYVREAAAAPTLAVAAERLGVSQPALSQGIAEVERRLGVTLFDRRARTRVPTEALGVVVQVAKQVLAAVEDLDRYLLDVAVGASGSVRVGMIDTAALGAFAAPLAAFRTAHPDVQTTLVVSGSIRLTEQVADGELDLAIVVTPNAVMEHNVGRLEVTPLAHDPLMIYARSDAERGTRLANLGPWVSYPIGSETRTLIGRALATRGVAMEVTAESSNPDVLRQMVRLGVGSCVLPRTVGESGTAALKPFEKLPLTTRTLSLIRRHDALPNAAADQLVADLKVHGATSLRA
jgi:DNA-binding transcriptional LysR family regulator